MIEHTFKTDENTERITHKAHTNRSGRFGARENRKTEFFEF